MILCSRSGADVREAMTVGCKPTRKRIIQKIVFYFTTYAYGARAQLHIYRGVALSPSGGARRPSRFAWRAPRRVARLCLAPCRARSCRAAAAPQLPRQISMIIEWAATPGNRGAELFRRAVRLVLFCSPLR